MPGLKTRAPRASKAYQLVEVNDLTGGQNLRVSPTLLKPEQAIENRNVSLAEPGAWSVRAGYRQHSTGNLGSGRAQGGQRVYLSSHTFTLVAWNQGVYLGDSTLTSTSAAVLSG